jgi:hypothetical protein
MNRTHLVAILGTVVLSTASLASGMGFQVVYNGGSIQNLKPGTHVSFRVEGRQLHVVDGDSEVATVPTSAISGISFHDDAATRPSDAARVQATNVGYSDAMNLTPANHRSVIVTWADGDRKGGFALQCEPTECPLVLAALQGVSGKQALDLDVPAAR